MTYPFFFMWSRQSIYMETSSLHKSFRISNLWFKVICTSISASYLRDANDLKRRLWWKEKIMFQMLKGLIQVSIHTHKHTYIYIYIYHILFIYFFFPALLFSYLVGGINFNYLNDINLVSCLFFRFRTFQIAL